MIKKIGFNNEQDFKANTNKFDWCEQVEAYHQTLNPAVAYSDDENNVKDIKDTFAIKLEADKYVIVEYEGSNYIPQVRKKLAEVTQDD